MKRLGDWFGGMIVAAIFATQLLPVLGGLVLVFHDPFANYGTISITFVSDQPEDVWIVAYDLPEHGRLMEEAGVAYRVDSPAGRGTMGSRRMSGPEGRRRAQIRYRHGLDRDVQTFRFDVDIVGQSQCQVVVEFGQDGPRANPCTHPVPARYDWLD